MVVETECAARRTPERPEVVERRAVEEKRVELDPTEHRDHRVPDDVTAIVDPTGEGAAGDVAREARQLTEVECGSARNAERVRTQQRHCEAWDSRGGQRDL